MGATLSFYLSRRGRRPVPVAQPPIAVGDSRNILPNETTVQVNVLANDLHVAGAAVTIPTPATGADAAVVGSAIHVTRIGTAAGSYSLTYRVTTAKGSSDAILSGTIEAALGAPTAVNDTRNLSSVEISAPVDVLANDSDVAGGEVTIPEAATGATATVEPDNRIRVERVGTGSGSYSLTYRVTTAGGFDEAVLSGDIAAYVQTEMPTFDGTTAVPGSAMPFFDGTTASPGAAMPAYEGTSGSEPPSGRTFYVSPTGDNGNPGSEAQPFLTLNGALAAVSPALGANDTVIAENGTYAENVIVNKGGDATGHLVLKARNRGAALIRPTGGNHGIHCQKDYITLDGFDVSGPNLVFHGIAADRLDGVGTNRGVHHITVKHCKSHGNTISGIGLAYGDYYVVEYCETYGNCHSCPQGIQGSGISIYQAREFDAAAGIHNIIHSNICYENIILHLRNGNNGPFYLVTADAGTDTFSMVSTTAGPPTNASSVRFVAGPGGSLPGGISEGTNYTIANRQTAPTPDTFQVTVGGVTVDLTSNGSGDIYVEPDHTDANGIIIDDFRNSQSTPGSGTIYLRTTLVENNLCYGNGNRGIHLFKSNNVVVKNNTCHGNNLDALSQGTWREELSNAQSSFNRWTNNIGVVAGGTTIAGVTKRAIGDRDIGGDRNVDVIWTANLTFDEATPGSNSMIMSLTRADATLTEPPNLLGENPLLVNAAADDFHLQASSPAIDAGSAAQGLATFDLDGNARVVGGVVDIGCYEHQG